MKSRVWVLIIFALLIIMIGTYIAAFRIFDINRKVGDYLSNQISQSFGTHVSSLSVSVLPWSIIIRDAKLEVDGVPLHITVKRVRAGFSFFSLLKSRFRSIYGIKIYLNQPEFIWHIDSRLHCLYEVCLPVLQLSLLPGEPGFQRLPFFSPTEPGRGD